MAAMQRVLEEDAAEEEKMESVEESIRKGEKMKKSKVNMSGLESPSLAKQSRYHSHPPPRHYVENRRAQNIIFSPPAGPQSTFWNQALDTWRTSSPPRFPQAFESCKCFS
jgi:hypothetical protein